MSDYYGYPNPTPGLVGAAPSATDLASLYSGAGAGANAVGAGASGTSFLSGMLGRVPSSLGQYAGPAALGGTGELGLMASLAPAIGPMAASQLATFGINKLLPSTGGAGDVRQSLADAATGAGMGAALGTTVFPGVGTATGALVGGAAGGLYGLADTLFGGDNAPSKDDIRTSLSAAAGQLNLDPKEYTTAFDLLTQNGADPKTLAQQLTVKLLQDSETQKAIAAQQQQQATQQQADQRFGLAMQAQAQEFFTPYVNNIISSGLAQSEALKGMAQNLPAPYRDVFMNQAQSAMAGSQRLAGAYAAQSSLIPGQFMAQAELKRQQAIANLQYQQAVIQARQQGGGGSGANQLLNQAQAAQSQQQQLTPTG